MRLLQANGILRYWLSQTLMKDQRLNKSKKKKTWHKPNELHSFKTNSICRTNYVTFITINDFIFKKTNKQKIIYDNDYVKHFHVMYISQTEFIQRRKKVSNTWCHKHSTICVLYRYIYTTSKIFGHFHSCTSLACTCTHRKILFPVIAKRVSNILRRETALRFWRKKLGECIQREITLRNQHSKTRFSFASICIFSFFF